MMDVLVSGGRDFGIKAHGFPDGSCSFEKQRFQRELLRSYDRSINLVGSLSTTFPRLQNIWQPITSGPRECEDAYGPSRRVLVQPNEHALKEWPKKVLRVSRHQITRSSIPCVPAFPSPSEESLTRYRQVPTASCFSKETPGHVSAEEHSAARGGAVVSPQRNIYDCSTVRCTSPQQERCNGWVLPAWMTNPLFVHHFWRRSSSTLSSRLRFYRKSISEPGSPVSLPDTPFLSAERVLPDNFERGFTKPRPFSPPVIPQLPVSKVLPASVEPATKAHYSGLRSAMQRCSVTTAATTTASTILPGEGVPSASIHLHSIPPILVLKPIYPFASPRAPARWQSFGPTRFDVLRALWVDVAAVTIQSCWRGHLGRREARERLLKRSWREKANSAASKIQQAFRRRRQEFAQACSIVSFVLYTRRKQAVRSIERLYLSWKARCAAKLEALTAVLMRVRRAAAVEIQRCFKGYVTRKKLDARASQWIVTWTYDSPGRVVELIGSFTKPPWRKRVLLAWDFDLKCYAATLPRIPGRHEFKFIIDGTYCCDGSLTVVSWREMKDQLIIDGWGHYNNVVILTSPPDKPPFRAIRERLRAIRVRRCRLPEALSSPAPLALTVGTDADELAALISASSYFESVLRTTPRPGAQASPFEEKKPPLSTKSPDRLFRDRREVPLLAGALQEDTLQPSPTQQVEKPPFSSNTVAETSRKANLAPQPSPCPELPKQPTGRGSFYEEYGRQLQMVETVTDLMDDDSKISMSTTTAAATVTQNLEIETNGSLKNYRKPITLLETNCTSFDDEVTVGGASGHHLEKLCLPLLHKREKPLQSVRRTRYPESAADCTPSGTTSQPFSEVPEVSRENSNSLSNHTDEDLCSDEHPEDAAAAAAAVEAFQMYSSGFFPKKGDRSSRSTPAGRGSGRKPFSIIFDRHNSGYSEVWRRRKGSPYWSLALPRKSLPSYSPIVTLSSLSSSDVSESLRGESISPLSSTSTPSVQRTAPRIRSDSVRRASRAAAVATLESQPITVPPPSAPPNTKQEVKNHNRDSNKTSLPIVGWSGMRRDRHDHDHDHNGIFVKEDRIFSYADSARTPYKTAEEKSDMVSGVTAQNPQREEKGFEAVAPESIPRDSCNSIPQDSFIEDFAEMESRLCIAPNNELIFSQTDLLPERQIKVPPDIPTSNALYSDFAETRETSQTGVTQSFSVVTQTSTDAAAAVRLAFLTNTGASHEHAPGSQPKHVSETANSA